MVFKRWYKKIICSNIFLQTRNINRSSDGKNKDRPNGTVYLKRISILVSHAIKIKIAKPIHFVAAIIVVHPVTLALRGKRHTRIIVIIRMNARPDVV